MWKIVGGRTAEIAVLAIAAKVLAPSEGAGRA
jgi:hypothetical protein